MLKLTRCRLMQAALRPSLEREALDSKFHTAVLLRKCPELLSCCNRTGLR